MWDDVGIRTMMGVVSTEDPDDVLFTLIPFSKHPSCAKTLSRGQVTSLPQRKPRSTTNMSNLTLTDTRASEGPRPALCTAQWSAGSATVIISAGNGSAGTIRAVCCAAGAGIGGRGGGAGVS